jgi:hypothetical protein
MPGGQRGLASSDDRRGGGEIRLADFQVDHVVPRRLQLVGPGKQRHYMKGFNGAAARAVGMGHDLLSIATKLEILPLQTIERPAQVSVNKQDRAG